MVLNKILVSNMARKRFSFQNSTTPKISLTPLIDTAFTLLIIFMVTTPMLQNSLKITLPETKNSAQSSFSQENVVVTIGKDNQLQVGNTNVTKDNLVSLVKKDLLKSRDKIVIIKGDKSVLYQEIIAVVDQINSVPGVKHVALAAQRSA